MSIAQPSANQIANIYQGNPGALNARIQQEQKGKPAGLPPDLTKLMALNINVNEQDAAKRQQAMSALQSMQQQGGGELPTVAQTLIEQAKQKAQIMQQQMQQMQPKPQGLMALLQQRGMPQAPENAPRPERQASGIDELSSNVGEHFDGGGIVAFEEGGKTDDKEKLTEEQAREILRRMRQRTDMRPESMAITEMDTTSIPGFEAGTRFKEEMDRASGRRQPMTPQQMEANVKAPLSEEESRRQALISQIPTGGQTAPASNRRGEDSELDRNIANTLAALPGASVTRAPTGIRALAPMLAALFSKDKQEASAPVDSRAALNAAEQRMREPAPAPSNRALLNAADAESRGLPAALKREAPPVVDRPPVVSQNRPVSAPTAPAAPSVAAPAPVSKMDQFLASQFDKTPEQRRLEAIERYKKDIGDPDTAAQERYIKQLEESRSRFAEPTDFAGRLAQWARATANAGGRSSLDAGARGAAALEAARQSNAQKDIELLKELMSESSKVADTKRGYKKEVTLFGEKQYEEAFKNGLEAAKEMGLDKRQAQLFAHQSAENALQRANALKVASVPSSERLMFNEFASAWSKKPENKGKSIDDAYAAYRMAGSPSAGMRGAMTRDQASDNVMKKLDFASPVRSELMNEAKTALVKAGVTSPTASQIMDYLIDKEMGKSVSASTPATSSGKVVDFSSLPK